MTPQPRPEEAAERIRAFCAAARRGMEGVSDGPWLEGVRNTKESETFKPGVPSMTVSRPDWAVVAVCGRADIVEKNSAEDVAFIAASRSWVPVMVSALEAAVAEWEAIHEANKKAGLLGETADCDSMIVALASALPPAPKEVKEEKSTKGEING